MAIVGQVAFLSGCSLIASLPVGRRQYLFCLLWKWCDFDESRLHPDITHQLCDKHDCYAASFYPPLCYAPIQKHAKSWEAALNPFCWRLIALIALALHSGFSRKGTSVTRWAIHLHSSSPVFFCEWFFFVGDQWREGMSYLPQTTLQGRGLDDISWNKAAESAEWSRSCWWVCKWAVSGAESSLQNTPFQYVTSRKKSSLLGHSQQMRSIKCPLTRRRKMCWRPDAAPSCIKRHLLKTLSIYLYRL